MCVLVDIYVCMWQRSIQSSSSSPHNWSLFWLHLALYQNKCPISLTFSTIKNVQPPTAYRMSGMGIELIFLFPEAFGPAFALFQPFCELYPQIDAMRSLKTILVISIISHTTSLSFLPPKLPNNFKPTTPHRNLPLSSALAFPLAISLFFSTANPLPSLATADCQKDCLKNCSLLGEKL